ncbi:MAG: hypothetical protein FJY75_01825 [Candidatus Eisenbacteria bacterium]|uniref:Uncharacterized protein n=1 Tax=Eiseniibacteriota bacterium TaxID=2212470 RepID=A0A937X9K8_UNCEI|nr:hypothetical protein [Candidatus Eisenbacteria bacterium]
MVAGSAAAATTAVSPIASAEAGAEVAFPGACAEAGAEVAPPAVLLGLSQAIPGWELVEEPQAFAADDLWRHIDGAAEQYLLFGCTRLTVAHYAPTAGAGGAGGTAAGGGEEAEPPPEAANGEASAAEVSVEIYETADSLGSFGLYALERPRGAAALALGAQGGAAGSEIRFHGGRYYVKVFAHPEEEAAGAAALALAERIAAGIMPGSRLPAELAFFPTERLAEEPFGFVPRAALSVEGMDRALSARYGSADAGMVVYLTCAPDTAAAEAAHGAARAAFERRSEGPVESLVVGGVGAERAQLKYRGPALLLRRGRHLILAAPLPAEPWGAATIAELIGNLPR